jgi:hypothetical protein
MTYLLKILEYTFEYISFNDICNINISLCNTIYRNNIIYLMSNYFKLYKKLIIENKCINILSINFIFKYMKNLELLEIINCRYITNKLKLYEYPLLEEITLIINNNTEINIINDKNCINISILKDLKKLEMNIIDKKNNIDISIFKDLKKLEIKNNIKNLNNLFLKFIVNIISNSPELEIINIYNIKLYQTILCEIYISAIECYNLKYINFNFEHTGIPYINFNETKLIKYKNLINFFKIKIDELNNCTVSYTFIEQLFLIYLYKKCKFKINNEITYILTDDLRDLYSIIVSNKNIPLKIKNKDLNKFIEKFCNFIIK